MGGSEPGASAALKAPRERRPQQSQPSRCRILPPICPWEGGRLRRQRREVCKTLGGDAQSPSRSSKVFKDKPRAGQGARSLWACGVVGVVLAGRRARTATPETSSAFGALQPHGQSTRLRQPPQLTAQRAGTYPEGLRRQQRSLLHGEQRNGALSAVSGLPSGRRD